MRAVISIQCGRGSNGHAINSIELEAAESVDRGDICPSVVVAFLPDVLRLFTV
jgi:hypothetical protein